MEISEKDIEWTTGTDKPYDQVTREWWADFMSENPDKLIELKHEINSRKKIIDDMKDRYDRMINHTAKQVAVDLLNYIESSEKALCALNELYKRLAINEDETDGRETQGEKAAIQKFWAENKDKYLIEDNKLNGYYNRHGIAKQLKEDGGFNSSLATIKDHANLHNY